MEKVTVVEIWKFLKYMGLLSAKRLFWQIKTRYWCAKRHNQFEQVFMLHGAGRYVYQGYKCAKCNAVHYEFKVNI